MQTGMYASRMFNCVGAGDWEGIGLGSQLLVRDGSNSTLVDAISLDTGRELPNGDCEWRLTFRLPSRVELVEFAFTGAVQGPVVVRRSEVDTKRGVTLRFIFGVDNRTAGGIVVERGGGE